MYNLFSVNCHIYMYLYMYSISRPFICIATSLCASVFLPLRNVNLMCIVAVCAVVRVVLTSCYVSVVTSRSERGSVDHALLFVVCLPVAVIWLSAVVVDVGCTFACVQFLWFVSLGSVVVNWLAAVIIDDVFARVSWWGFIGGADCLPGLWLMWRNYVLYLFEENAGKTQGVSQS